MLYVLRKASICETMSITNKKKHKAYNLKQNMENFRTTFIVTVP